MRGLLAHFIPLIEVVRKLEFRFDAPDRGEEKLADVSESGGIARRNAILGDSGVEFAEYVVHVGCGHVIAGQGLGEFGAETVGFEEL
jgi:hypothetical protein